MTGVRHDARAEANRVRAEEEKAGAVRATYLHSNLPDRAAGRLTGAAARI